MSRNFQSWIFLWKENKQHVKILLLFCFAFNFFFVINDFVKNMPSTNPVMVAIPQPEESLWILSPPAIYNHLLVTSHFILFTYININPSFNSIFVYLSQITLSTQFPTHLMLFGFGGVFCCLVDRLGFFVGARMKVVVLWVLFIYLEIRKPILNQLNAFLFPFHLTVTLTPEMLKPI